MKSNFGPNFVGPKYSSASQEVAKIWADEYFRPAKIWADKVWTDKVLTEGPSIPKT